MSDEKKCFLECLNDTQSRIMLTNHVKFIGRSAETKIEDVFVSRRQVSAKVDFDENIVHITQIGQNLAGLNGLAMEMNKNYKGYHGDVLEILHTKYLYRIVFDPPPLVPLSSKSELRINKRPSTVCSDNADTSIVKRAKIELQKPAVEHSWEEIDGGKLLIFTSKGVVSSESIASYDIDGTIIQTKSGNVFAKTIDDWKISFSEVPGKLKSLHSDGYKIVFFTNQAGISNGKTLKSDFKKKIERIVTKLNVPVQVFVSTEKSIFRKPMTGMWKQLQDEMNDNLVINKEKSFYVGDAAGRPEQKLIKRKKDHSLADRLFAINVGIDFFTPEEHFQNKKTENWTKPEFNPTTPFPTSLIEPANSSLTSNKLEVILLVGGPGSGKSFFAKTHFASQGYTIINRDTLKTWQKCVEALTNSLESRKSAVIDNTNGDKLSRKRYIDVAKTFKTPCRAFIMNTTKKHCKHNILFRQLFDKTANHAPISDMVLNGYFSKYAEPVKTEGFSEIVRVNLVPQFDSKEDEAIYKSYLID